VFKNNEENKAMLDLFMMFSYTQDKAAIAIDALWRI